MESYRVRYERDPSGWWIVTIPEVQGCRSQGRSIAEGRNRIREALAPLIDDAATERAQFVDDIRLPAAMKRRIREIAAVRLRAEELKERAQEVTRRLDHAPATTGVTLPPGPEWRNRQTQGT